MKTILLGFLLAVTAGCVVRGSGEVAVVEQGHVCKDDCDHHYREGRYYRGHGHRHGPNCGHALSGGLWIAVR